jgi:hypothetical protein
MTKSKNQRETPGIPTYERVRERPVRGVDAEAVSLAGWFMVKLAPD